MTAFYKILGKNPAIVLLLDSLNGNIVDANEAAIAFYGYTYEELCSINFSAIKVPSADDNTVKKLNDTSFPKIDFQDHSLKDESIRKVQCLNSLINLDGKSCFLKIIQDITENERNKRFKNFIFEVNQLVIKASSTEEIFKGFCRIAVEAGGFLLAFVCTPNAEFHKIEPLFFEGEESGYLDDIKFSTDSDELFGKGPLGTAYNTRKYYYCNDIKHDPIMQPWREKALKTGFRSSIAVPIIVENSVFSLLSIYNPQPNYFNSEEVRILVLIADNVAFAINNFKNEAKRKAIEASEKLIKTVIDDSTAFIGFADNDRNIIFWNKALRNLIRPEVFIKGNYELTDIYTGEHLKERLLIEESFSQTSSWSGESEVNSVNGPVPVYQVFKRHELNGQKFLSITAIDISEVKKAREEIADFKEMVENSTAFISRSDANRNLIYVNRALRQHLEISESEELSNYKIDDFREKNPSASMKINDAIQKDGKWAGEEVLVSKSGNRIPVAEVIVGHHNSDGEFTGRSLTAIDISDIRKTTRQLENLNKLMETSPAFVLITDMNFNFIYANLAYRQLLGIKESYNIDNLNLLDYIDLEQISFREYIRESIFIKGNWTGETSFINNKGNLITVWATMVLNRDTSNVPVSMAMTAIDISIQKEIEKQKFINKLKSDFVSFASHEIRTPLTAIKSSAELILLFAGRHEPVNISKIKHYLENIILEVDRLSLMVAEILTLEKIESGKIGITKQLIDLKKCIVESIEKFTLNNINKRQVLLTSEKDDIMIESDPILLDHIISNLLSNADKYSQGKRPPEVFIRYKKNTTEIEVKDYGIGIPEKEQSALFSSFFRASNTTGISGTGIGLTIVNSFVSMLSGDIRIESKEGKGTRIFINFPISK